MPLLLDCTTRRANQGSDSASYDVVIIGAGAAGLMCAIEAGKRGRRTAVLERAERAGKKVLISGGGRCNFTNLHCTAANFLSGNPHFAKSALSRYTPADFIAMVEKHGIAYHEKTLGQLFCDGSARGIVAMLERECAEANVDIFLNSTVANVQKHDDTFVLTASVAASERSFLAESLVVATGGLSIPKMGATSFGYDLARQFGLKIRDCRPALVPFTFSDEDRYAYCDLAGLSTEVIASASDASFRERMLITHRGLSGPAVLQISSYWRPGEIVSIDLAPGHAAFATLLASPSGRDIAAARAALRVLLPTRLADHWLEQHAPARWTTHDIHQLEHILHHWNVKPAGTEGFAKAEVTVGGVDTDELSARTMECRAVPGLYFIGEVVDVTGQLGGFNFQWAWASGHAAGQAV